MKTLKTLGGSREAYLASRRAYNVMHREEILAKKREYNATHREEMLVYKRDYYAKNADELRRKAREYGSKPEVVIARKKRRISTPELLAAARAKSLRWYYSPSGIAYKKKNAGRISASKATYKALKLRAMPHWVDRKAIDAVYKKAVDKTRRTGIKYTVDHIYPLRGVGFNGLHVPWNLQVITATANESKGNRI